MKLYPFGSNKNGNLVTGLGPAGTTLYGGTFTRSLEFDQAHCIVVFTQFQESAFEQICNSYKFSDELCYWLAIKSPRIISLLNFTFIHYYQLVTETHRLVLIMGNVNGRNTNLALDILEKIAHLLPEISIKIT